ncbi:hypothetical protein MMC14_004874 [Varicellaria rhodocarpa]|nr:hypothetical protein [Varicellaria rhodocarpa]
MLLEQVDVDVQGLTLTLSEEEFDFDETAALLVEAVKSVEKIAGFARQRLNSKGQDINVIFEEDAKIFFQRKYLDGVAQMIASDKAKSLLTFLLHPKLHESAVKYGTESHITVTASELYELVKLKERNAPDGQLLAALNDKSTANMADRYNVSKLLGILVVKQMAVLFPLTLASELTSERGDSSIIRSAKRISCRQTEVGARTLVYGASAGPESHGQHVPDCKITPTQGLTKGEAGITLQNQVWVETGKKLEDIRPCVTSLS